MKNLTRLLLLSIASFMLFTELNAAPAKTGQAMGDKKIGFVNFDIAFSQEEEAQYHIKDLEKKGMEIGVSEQKARIDIETKMNNYKNTSSKLSDKARQEQEQKLSQEIGALQQQFATSRGVLEQEQKGILRDLETKNRLLIESISKEGGYDLVFNAATLVYVSDEIKKNDLTPILVTKYNKTYPVKPAAPAKNAGVKNGLDNKNKAKK